MPGSTVSTVAGLNAAIEAADALSTNAGVYTITLSSNISLNGTELEAINLKTGVTLDMVGSNGASSYALDGAGIDRGLFVYAGTVSIENLLIENMNAVGGAGGSAAGGGAGLGGGLFIGSNVAGDAGSVTLNNVSFAGDTARGGAGGGNKGTSGFGGESGGGGGGGGLGGGGGSPASGSDAVAYGAGGGGIGVGAVGGGPGHQSGAGIVPGADGGGSGAEIRGGLGFGAASGGGGGGDYDHTSSGGGGGGVDGGSAGVVGGNGGFGGGGGGGSGRSEGTGGAGGFGGGAGASGYGRNAADQGGFGGGGADSSGAGGFGGGNGASTFTGGGGGGLAAGGDIFVQAGASLTISGSSATANGTVTGGAAGQGGQAGQAFGAGIYLQGANTLTLSNNGGLTAIAATIADDKGAAMAASYAGAAGYTEGSIGITVAGSGTLILAGTNTYTGGTTITAGILEIASAANIGSGAVIFGSGTTLQIDTAPVNGSIFGNALTGFGTFGTIDLRGLAYVYGATATFAGTALMLTDGADTQYFTLSTTPAAGTSFIAHADGMGGTAVGVACYVAGTLILTDCGERAVEHLQIGDVVVTASGVHRSIRWLGRRAYAGRFLAANPGVQPIRMRAGSLGAGLPRRDLLVSPEHAMLLDGVLVPARCLINDANIVQERGLERVDYVHVELQSHDAILAEGAASETFRDHNSRGMFHNAHECARLAPIIASDDLPRLEEGPALDALRRRIAGMSEPAGILEGWLDEVDGERISGWARDHDAPTRRVQLRVRDGGAILGEVVAGDYRADLSRAGIGDGCFSFSFVVPGGLSPALRHVVSVERVADGALLRGSPWVREAQALAATITVAASNTAGLRGALDVCARDRFAGWAWAPGRDGPVALQILDNGLPVARVLANVARSDLVAAGIGSGRHGFDVLIPGGLSPLVRHVIDIARECDGARLPGAPAVIEPAGMFDAGLEATVAAAVAALTSGEQQERVLGFLRGQAERLQQGRADADTRRVAREAARRHRRRWGSEPTDTAKRALVVDSTLPQPGHSGGNNAILSHVAGLQRLGYAVSLVAADEMAAGHSFLKAAGVTVLGLPFYASVEEVLRRQSGCFEVVYLHRIEMMARYMHLVRQQAPQARLLYSVADLHHLRLARQAEIQKEPALLAISHKLRAMERAAAEAADGVLTHSHAEAALLRKLVPAAHVQRIPWAITPQPRRPAFSKRSGVAFVGYFGHEPNVDAAIWLADVVMPLVWQHQPGLGCVIVGRAMPTTVQALVRPGITVLGEVVDLRAVYDRVRLTAAPLRFGAGVKSKVLESFAAGLPCVMTQVAAEGIELPPGLRSLITSSPEDMAARILGLHQDPAANRAAAAEGVALIRSFHNEEAVSEALKAAITGELVGLQRAG